ncbi:LytTR family transcriptional regulator DNA-binding domain-containing protein [Arenibacter sp. F20364]|uniref:LytTR family transcriptional regulator DNA-binding domain-containing protein n=1 Tax=Arenibacter sp. F20364 TaxID=2926415 RepID=UPI001FF576C9|nr:LytTR family transcriptional regulator DNA-binding domain-containing protein [Arenibacter sp. F20364]
MVNKETILEFENFPDLKSEESIKRQWALNKNAFVDNGEKLVFFYLEDNQLEDRIKLRGFLSYYRNNERELNKQKNLHNHARIVVTVREASLFYNFYGWEEDISFCYNLDKDASDVMKKLVNRLMYYPFDKNAPIEKMKIKSKGSFDLEFISDICYCVASQNYTEIHLANGKKRLESKAIAFIEKRLNNVSCIQKVGRSYMINRNRILKVDAEKVWFTANHGCPSRIVSLGPEYIKRIRKFVYWY